MTDDVDDAAYRCTYDHPNMALGSMFLKVRIHPSKADNYKEISTSNCVTRYEYTSGDILDFSMPANSTIVRDLNFFLSDVKV